VTELTSDRLPPLPISEFARYLASTLRDGTNIDRGTLSRLRRGQRDRFPWENMDIQLEVGDKLLDVQSRAAKRPFYIVAVLFPISPRMGGDGADIGSVLGKLKVSGRLTKSKENEFIGLLKIDRIEDIVGPLRHMVRYLASKDKTIDWIRLLKDLISWEDEDHKVQQRWIDSFHRPSRPTATERQRTEDGDDVE